ncbi:unnamed protein product [Lactuca virosa]|uniref:Uncharacterized protein n=1 Tax=Lactuca virosa TaxID=75947 RepID=A0AAU9PSU5_9ASTR|nr:unnamed protein product [Lactuca virosa]
MDACNQKSLEIFEEEVSIEGLDWCDFVIACLSQIQKTSRILNICWSGCISSVIVSSLHKDIFRIIRYEFIDDPKVKDSETIKKDFKENIDFLFKSYYYLKPTIDDWINRSWNQLPGNKEMLKYADKRNVEFNQVHQNLVLFFGPKVNQHVEASKNLTNVEKQNEDVQGWDFPLLATRNHREKVYESANGSVDIRFVMEFPITGCRIHKCVIDLWYDFLNDLKKFKEIKMKVIDNDMTRGGIPSKYRVFLDNLKTMSK